MMYASRKLAQIACFILFLNIASVILAKAWFGAPECNNCGMEVYPGVGTNPGPDGMECAGSLAGGGGGTSGGGSSGGGSSCSSCGSAGASSGLSGPAFTSASDVSRYWSSSLRDANSSFSPGFYSQYDSQIQLFPETGGLSLEFTSAIAKKSFVFVDGVGGDTQDGVFHDLVNASSRKIELLNGSNALVTSPASATKLKVTHWNGFVEEFGLIDLDASSTATAWAGRLTKRVDTVGRELTVTYKSWTQTQIDASPSRQWQIDVVSDSYGKSLAFTYDSTQHSGRWCVTEIARNDGPSVTFGYSTDALTSVGLADGSSTTYAYAQDTVNDTTVVTTSERMNADMTGKFHLANDFSIGVTDPPTLAYRTPGRALARETLNSETMWKIALPTDPATDRMLVIRAGAASVVYGTVLSRKSPVTQNRLVVVAGSLLSALCVSAAVNFLCALSLCSSLSLSLCSVRCCVCDATTRDGESSFVLGVGGFRAAHDTRHTTHDTRHTTHDTQSKYTLGVLVYRRI